MTQTYDFICVGAGLGGLSAAIRAHDLGLSVLVLERSSYVGGVAAYSGGFVWLGDNHLAAADDSLPDDSIEATEDYLDHVHGEGRPLDRALRRNLLVVAREALEYYDRAGVPLSVIRGASDLYAPAAPGATSEGRLIESALDGGSLGDWASVCRPSPHYRTGVTRTELYARAVDGSSAEHPSFEDRQAADFRTHGHGLASAFVRAALTERGIDCLLERRARRLVVEDDRVVGVVAEGPDGEEEFRATKGVLLATGGYGSAPYAAELEDLPSMIEASPPVVDGDNLVLAEGVGGAVVRGADPFFVLGVGFGDETHPGTAVPLYRQVYESVGLPHSMIVNSGGERFGDESYYGALIAGLRRIEPRSKKWANYPCHLIVDDRFRRRYAFGPLAAGSEWPAEFVSADTLEELAAKVGIDPAGLADTASRFNEFAERGEDDDFGRGSLPFARVAYGDATHGPNPNLGSLEQGPFHAVPLTLLGVGLCSLGLSIDGDARVLRREGQVVEGLYATGNAAATKELKGYVTGFANMRNIAYGYQAANRAAR